MPKLVVAVSALLATGLALPATGRAAVLGPHAAQCDGRHPAMLVHVIGLRERSGVVRIQSYGGDPATFLDKGAYMERVELIPPAGGSIEVCMPVPKAGVYAILVRHKTTGTSEMDDGGGVSGNPHRSLMDLIFKRKPAPADMSVRVAGVVTVPVIMNYLQGGSFRPVRTAER